MDRWVSLFFIILWFTTCSSPVTGNVAPTTYSISVTPVAGKLHTSTQVPLKPDVGQTTIANGTTTMKPGPMPHKENGTKSNKTLSFTDQLAGLAGLLNQLSHHHKPASAKKPIAVFTSGLLPLVEPLMLGEPLPNDTFSKVAALAAKVLNMMVTPFTSSGDVSSDCVIGIRSFINGTANGEEKYLQMLDAWAKPPTSILHGNIAWVGNFEECVKYGSYFVLDLVPPDMVKDRLNVKSPTGPLSFRVDVCMPSSCNVTDIEGLTDGIVQDLGMNITEIKRPTSVGSIKKDNNAIIAFCVITVIGCVTALAVLFDCYISTPSQTPVEFKNMRANRILEYTKTNPAFEPDEEDEPAVSNNVERIGIRVLPKDPDTMPEEPESSPSSIGGISLSNMFEETGVLGRLLLSFSIGRNFNRAVDWNQRTDWQHISCINGIRVLSMGFIMLGFIFTSYMPEMLENGLDLLNDKHAFRMQPIINSTLAVDTFFLISGFLACYYFMRAVEKKGGLSVIHFVYYYLHRITRLTILYAFILMVYYCLSPYLLRGPYQDVNSQDRKNCADGWWYNLLYFNNLYKTDKMCMAWTWFMADIMQFHIIAPLLIVPLILIKWVGVLISLLLVGLHIAMTAYEHQSVGGNILDSGMFSGSTDTWFSQVYIKPWTRCGPYAIGILLGFIIFKTKQKMQSINTQFATVCWGVSLALIVLSTFVTYSDYHGDTDAWSMIDLTIYQSLFRISWSLGVAWLIFACVNGYGGFINSLLSWKIWTPLARLTFAAYLVHPMVQALYLYNMKNKLYYNSLTVIYNFSALTSISYFGALFVYVSVEAPFAALERTIWRKENTEG